MSRPIQTSILVFALILGACATPPPATDYMAEPRAALEAAIAGGADKHAPVDLRFAREKLEAAEAAAAEGDYKLAERLAAQASVDSAVALARAESAQARRESLQMERRNQQLQSELDADQ